MLPQLPLLPDPDAVRLTRAVRGHDHTGAEVSLSVVEERPLTIYLNSQEIVTAMTIGGLSRVSGAGIFAQSRHAA